MLRTFIDLWPILKFIIIEGNVSSSRGSLVKSQFSKAIVQCLCQVLFYRLISFKATQLLNNCICVLLPTPVPILSLPPHKGHFQEMHGFHASIEFMYFRLAKHAMLTKLPSCQQLSTISSGSGVIIQGPHYSSS